MTVHQAHPRPQDGQPWPLCWVAVGRTLTPSEVRTVDALARMLGPDGPELATDPDLVTCHPCQEQAHG